MSCLNPRKVWWSKERHPETGNRVPVFNSNKSCDIYPPYPMKCGKCNNCLKTIVNDIATACSFELETCSQACFVTLTYDDDHLPVTAKCPTGTLVKSDLIKFHKRLRTWIDINSPGTRYKYLQSGEYGGEGDRPHYHLVIMGFDFPDKYQSPTCKNSKKPFFDSSVLDSLWTKGFTKLMPAEPDNILYVAKYAAKERMTGASTVYSYKKKFKKDNDRNPTCEDYINEFGRIPQFVSRSRLIGLDKLLQHHEEFLSRGTFIPPYADDNMLRTIVQNAQHEPSRGAGFPITSWMFKQLEKHYPEQSQPLKAKRKLLAGEATLDYQTGTKLIFGGTSDFDIKQMRLDNCKDAYYREFTVKNGITSDVAKDLRGTIRELEEPALFLATKMLDRS